MLPYEQNLLNYRLPIFLNLKNCQFTGMKSQKLGANLEQWDIIFGNGAECSVLPEISLAELSSPET